MDRIMSVWAEEMVVRCILLEPLNEGQVVQQWDQKRLIFYLN